MTTSQKITHHWQRDVYKLSVEAAMRLFELSKLFPREEMYSLTDQMRRSSRSDHIMGKLVKMQNNPEVWLPAHRNTRT